MGGDVRRTNVLKWMLTAWTKDSKYWSTEKQFGACHSRPWTENVVSRFPNCEAPLLEPTCTILYTFDKTVFWVEKVTLLIQTIPPTWNLIQLERHKISTTSGYDIKTVNMTWLQIVQLETVSPILLSKKACEGRYGSFDRLKYVVSVPKRYQKTP